MTGERIVTSANKVAVSLVVGGYALAGLVEASLLIYQYRLRALYRVASADFFVFALPLILGLGVCLLTNRIAAGRFLRRHVFLAGAYSLLVWFVSLVVVLNWFGE